MRDLGGIRQLGFVTDDVLAAAERWLAAGAAGPFFHLRDICFAGWTYRGQLQDLSLDIAFAQSGDVMVEFISPHGEWPNVYGDAPPSAGSIVPHHHGYLVPDMAAATRMLGDAPVITRGDVGPGAELRYLDMRDRLGVIVELISDCADSRRFFDFARDAAIDWTGTDPIRAIGFD